MKTDLRHFTNKSYLLYCALERLTFGICKLARRCAMFVSPQVANILSPPASAKLRDLTLGERVQFAVSDQGPASPTQ